MSSPPISKASLIPSSTSTTSLLSCCLNRNNTVLLRTDFHITSVIGSDIVNSLSAKDLRRPSQLAAALENSMLNRIVCQRAVTVPTGTTTSSGIPFTLPRLFTRAQSARLTLKECTPRP